MTTPRSHFIGIGGIGMSGIARYLIAHGKNVSGSDSKESATVTDLRQMGCQVFLGHHPENVHGATEIITSTAINPDNPEVQEARRLNIPIIHRSQKLAELVNARRGITIAGTHGKTTTSSMVATMLRHAGVGPSYVIGGIVNTFKDNASCGDTEWFVIEADESDGSLVAYTPEITALTNIELDHLDFYRSKEHLHEIFATHVGNVHPGGLVIYCADDPGCNELIAANRTSERDFLSYGLKDGAQIQATNIVSNGLQNQFDVLHHGALLGSITLAIPGHHNVQNSLVAVAVGLRLGLTFDQIASGLAEFQGVQRRFQILTQSDSYTIVDDYAHHPSEIAATLNAARHSHKDRIIAIFQPHRYSRTQAFAREFGAAFANANEVIITDIYAAGETPIPDITAELIIGHLNENHHPNTRYIACHNEIEEYIRGHIQPNDLVITLGAGDINKIAHNLSADLAALP